MRYDLQGKQGKAICAKRKGTVEAVFGIIYNAPGSRQFSMRRVKKHKASAHRCVDGVEYRRMFAMKAA